MSAGPGLRRSAPGGPACAVVRGPLARRLVGGRTSRITLESETISFNNLSSTRRPGKFMNASRWPGGGQRRCASSRRITARTGSCWSAISTTSGVELVQYRGLAARPADW